MISHRDAFVALAARGESRGAEEVLERARAGAPTAVTPVGHTGRRRSPSSARLRPLTAALAGFVLVALVVGAVATLDPFSAEVGGSPGPAGIAPQVTLPPEQADQVPMTTPQDLPLTYYRLEPDIDLAWKDEGGATRMCWRTPAEETCATDTAYEPWLIAPSADQVVAIAIDETASQPSVAALVTWSDGSNSSKPIEWKGDVALGTARFAVRPGLTPVSLDIVPVP